MKTRARSLLLFALFLAGFGFALLGVRAQESRTPVVAGLADGSLETPSTLVTAFPILNEGKAPIERIEVTAISIQGGTLTEPAKLPLALLGVRGGSRAVVFATFRGEFAPEKSYVMKVEGTATVVGRPFKFTLEHPVLVPPAAPGEARANSSTSAPHKVEGARFPHQPPRFPKEVNETTIWTVPIGAIHPLSGRSQESKIEKAPAGDPPGINFFTNAPVGINANSINEPSGGVGSDVIFETANSYASYSTNGGGSFTKLDPTTIFPNNVDGGFCCDQIVVYVPRFDRVIWLMQFWQGATPPGGKFGPNRYRIAAASPASIKSSHGTAWTYWDITSTQINATNWLDYPDLSFGDNSLYLSFDVVGSGRVVVRIPLSEIQASATINFWYTDPTKSPMGYGDHLTQNTRDEIFWAGHNSNSSMRVFNWPESTTTYSWRDIGVGTWPNNTLTSLTPDNQDWLNKLQNFPGNAPLGCTRVFSSGGKQVNQVWFAWSASKGNNFGQPHVQWVAFDRNNNFSLITQQQIWNNAYAFAYPAFATNSDNEVGMSLEWGGGGNYENHVAGFWGDFIVYITTSTNVGTARFGDYVTIRQDAAHSRRFDAFGYGLVKATPPATGTKSDTHYIQFGRPGS